MTIKEALNLLTIHGKNNLTILEGGENKWDVPSEEIDEVSGKFYIALDTLQRLVDRTNRYLHETKDFETS